MEHSPKVAILYPIIYVLRSAVLLTGGRGGQERRLLVPASSIVHTVPEWGSLSIEFQSQSPHPVCTLSAGRTVFQVTPSVDGAAGGGLLPAQTPVEVTFIQKIKNKNKKRRLSSALCKHGLKNAIPWIPPFHVVALSSVSLTVCVLFCMFPRACRSAHIYI